MKIALVTVACCAWLGCGTSADAPATVTDSGVDARADEGVAETLPADLRGVRYCETLLGKLSGDLLQIDVYNTLGLNDCPAELWAKQDVAALKAETMSDVVVLNGPRLWLVNSLAGSKLLDETVRTLGGIAMRKAGAIQFPVTALMEMQKPYALRTIQRDSVATFSAGKSVFELVDAEAHVYTMQSYSLQTEPQTEATLATLGSRLKVPAGWTFRTRTLTADLVVRAVDKTATVTTDELNNTYLRTQ